MSSSRARAVPELFLTFLAPSLRPALPRLPSSRRPLSSAIQAHKNATVSDQHARPSNRKVERKAEQQARSMSRIAATRTLEHSPAEPYVPVASTSAVQLDSPFDPPSPPPWNPWHPETLRPIANDDRESSLVELPAVLRHLRAISLKHPEQSPTEIISRARSRAFDDDTSRAPPSPPPPIPLHPQPYSSRSPFFTPLLLQAMILGASALGLLTRRKVRSLESSRSEPNRAGTKSAKAEAEDRVDEVQALNLLIAAHAVPRAGDSPKRERFEWRKEMTRSLVELVVRALRSDRPLNQVGIASILHFASPPLAACPTFTAARPVLLAHALEAYRSLGPSLHDPSSLELALATSNLSSFLSLVRPRDATAQTKTDTLFDRSILDVAASRILSCSSGDCDPRLAYDLAKAAARAKRLDIFSKVSQLPLEHHHRLEVAVMGLDLAASHQRWRNDRDVVLPFVDNFVTAVKSVESLDKRAICLLDRGIYLLRTAFSIDRPLEPFIARALLPTLSTLSVFEIRRYRSLVVDVLKHLSKSRNPSLTRQIFRALPPDRIRLAHLLPLLSSSHAATSQSAWQFLLDHPSIALTPAAASARFSSLSHRSTPRSTALESARRAFTTIRDRGLTPTVEIWNKFLLVNVRFGSDRAVETVLASMERAGIEENEWTRDVLLQRVMVRQDGQSRVARDRNTEDERERPRSERPEPVGDQVIRVKRSGGGRAQMRKLREAMRERENRETTGRLVRRRQGESTPSADTKVDITANLLLKNVTRWSNECDVPRLVQLAKVVLGIDLAAITESRHEARDSVDELLSHEEYRRQRVPAFKTLISAFERRGRVDLAQALRAKLRAEQATRAVEL